MKIETTELIYIISISISIILTLTSGIIAILKKYKKYKHLEKYQKKLTFYNNIFNKINANYDSENPKITILKSFSNLKGIEFISPEMNKFVNSFIENVKSDKEFDISLFQKTILEHIKIAQQKKIKTEKSL